jgi:hypothetical protein
MVIAPVTNYFQASTNLELKKHKTVLLIERQLYMGLAVGKILLLEGLKELVSDLVVKMVNTGLQSYKCNVIFPAMTHGSAFLPFPEAWTGFGKWEAKVGETGKFLEAILNYFRTEIRI